MSEYRPGTCEICGTVTKHLSITIPIIQSDRPVLSDRSDTIVMPNEREPRKLCEQCHRQENPSTSLYMTQSDPLFWGW